MPGKTAGGPLALHAPPDGTPLAPYVADFFKVWLRRYKAVSKHTERSYANAFKSLFRYMREVHGKRPKSILIEDLDEKRLLGYIDWMRRRGNKDSTCRTRIASLRSFARYLEHKLAYGAEFCLVVDRIKVARESGDTVKFLEREAVRALFEAAAEYGLREQTMLEVLYDTGARAAELVGIRVCDVAFPRGEKRASIRLYGKGGKARSVKISKQATVTLKVYMKKTPLEPDGPLFPGLHGRQLTTRGLAYTVSKCEKAARSKNPSLFPFKVHPHTLRHSVATHMIRAGVDMETIRLFLGHASSATTLVYAQVDPSSVADAIEVARTAVMVEAAPPQAKRDELEEWLAALLDE